MVMVYTIGHSNHPWTRFAELLNCAAIETLVDVRTHPRSRFSHFNQAALRGRLAASDIAYFYLGNDLGGRSSDGEIIDYDLAAQAAPFRHGMRLVEEMAGSTRLALMCSEHEPLACHRCLLIGRNLAERGVGVSNILRDSSIEPQTCTEERLLAIWKRSTHFNAVPEQVLAAAYRAQIVNLQRRSP